MAGTGENEEIGAAGTLYFESEALVGFFIEQRMRLGSAQDVPVKPVGALGDFVLDGVEERAIVRGPGSAGDPLDALGQDLARAQVFHLQRVLTEPGGVDRVGEEMIV